VSFDLRYSIFDIRYSIFDTGYWILDAELSNIELSNIHYHQKETMLELINIHKTYENQPLLKGISFSLSAGETICLLGASGSGKSTILRIIAGLEQADSGDVLWDGQSLTKTAVHQRNFGLMFQDYALFPHLNVFDNVAYGLQMKKWPKAEIAPRVDEVLGQVNLGGFARRRVTELSGGEQQRVALARALAPGPRLLMLDEPLGALDRALRESLLDELRSILHHTGIPAIYVTHDQQEAFTIADTIILLREGQIAQAGTPPEVFAHPADGWVARFLGLGNVVNAKIVGSLEGGPVKVDSPVGVLDVVCTHQHQLGEDITLLLRPRAELVETGETLTGVVADVVFREQAFRLELAGGMYFYVSTPCKIGQNVRLKILQVECL
jgi:ABC-type Fe3+/spermidine/putrescine transport system ATPase subunit